MLRFERYSSGFKDIEPRNSIFFVSFFCFACILLHLLYQASSFLFTFFNKDLRIQHADPKCLYKSIALYFCFSLICETVCLVGVCQLVYWPGAVVFSF